MAGATVRAFGARKGLQTRRMGARLVRAGLLLVPLALAWIVLPPPGGVVLLMLACLALTVGAVLLLWPRLRGVGARSSADSRHRPA